MGGYMAENRVGPPVRGKNFYGRQMDQPRWDYQIVHADLEHFIEPSELITKFIEQLASDSKFARFLEGLSYLPNQLWSAFRNAVEEIELYEVRVKLKEQIRLRWQESGEELFKRVAASPTAPIVILDEFPMMIDRMARLGGASCRSCDATPLATCARILHWWQSPSGVDALSRCQPIRCYGSASRARKVAKRSRVIVVRWKSGLMMKPLGTIAA
jgi:hypothetical protein